MVQGQRRQHPCAHTERVADHAVPMLKVYGFSRVNSVARGNTRDLRVLWALEEMQMPFELIGMNHPAHELSTDAYRKLSPFEQNRRACGVLSVFSLLCKHRIAFPVSILCLLCKTTPTRWA